MTPRKPSFHDGAIARTCTRWFGDHDCGKDAPYHVLWDEDLENGFVCEEHFEELGTVWTYYAYHETGPDCAMPGSKYYEEENVCRCDDDIVASVPVGRVVMVSG